MDISPVFETISFYRLDYSQLSKGNRLSKICRNAISVIVGTYSALYRAEEKMRFGVIADDFTGAVDAAGFIRNGGLKAIMFCGLPTYDELFSIPVDAAVIISLQIRACSVNSATAQAAAAASMLAKAGCPKLYFKYCSTFDSTSDGNIGPVADCIMKVLDIDSTVFAPSLPVNGRTVYMGYLFVNDRLLEDSPMRYHPVNPMTESYIPEILRNQFNGRTDVIPHAVICKGPEAIEEKALELSASGIRGFVVDAIDNDDVRKIAEAFKEYRFLTGGSALAGEIAGLLSVGCNTEAAEMPSPFPTGRTVIFVGSCSRKSNIQVSRYISDGGPARSVDIAACRAGLEMYAEELFRWISETESELAPMVYATKTPEELDDVAAMYPGEDIAALINALFAELAKLSLKGGFRRFIVGGGETSGSVVQASGERIFRIGPEISPGISWIYNEKASFALKSGNFGSDSFFEDVQKENNDVWDR